MSYRVYLEAGLLRLDFSGQMTKSDLVGAMREIETIETGLAQMPHRITDFTAWKGSENRFLEIFEAARQRQQKKFPNAFKSAFVTPQETTFGIVRMYQTMNDNPQITIQIFRDLASAQAWIAEG